MTGHRHPEPPALEPHWFQILLALADQDLHGLGIMNEVLERTGGRMRLWPAMLYRNLARLADLGLVDRSGPAARRTRRGRTAAFLSDYGGGPPRLCGRGAAPRRIRRGRPAQAAAESVNRMRRLLFLLLPRDAGVHQHELDEQFQYCVRRERARLGRLGVPYAWARFVLDVVMTSLLLRRDALAPAAHQPPRRCR